MIGMFKGFANWVDSFGEEAGETMLFGGFIGGLLGSVIAGMIGVGLGLTPLGYVGFILFALHLGYMLVSL